MRGLATCFLFAASLAEAQVITTVVGTDLSFPVNGIPAVNSIFRHVDAVATDAAGNLYISDVLDCIVARVSPDGVLTIVAGNGRAGFSGDGGPATSASLNYPSGIALDNAGSLYIADLYNNRVRKVSGGIISTVVGNGEVTSSGDGGPPLEASLYPSRVAVDSSGNLYISDPNANRIRRVSGRTITTYAGTGKSGFSGDQGPAAAASLSSPGGLAVDAGGNLYIADTGNSRVRRIDSRGIITTVAGNGIEGFSGDGGPATAASFNAPADIALDSAGNLYIADTDNNRIRRISSSGATISTIAGTGTDSISGPLGIATDSRGNLYVADTDNYRVRKVSGGVVTTVAGNGSAAAIGDGGPAAASLLNSPTSLALDSSGSLYIADLLNSRIRKVTGGTITTVAGNGSVGFSGDGQAATGASFNMPYGVATDLNGNLFIADSFNSRIRKVSGGTITTVAGNGTFDFSGDGQAATAASLNFPTAVAVDSSGNLYIADSSNNRIRKVSSDGRITTVAGNGNAGFSGDGLTATGASLNTPWGLAVDSAGNLFVADTYNHRIRKVSNGVISTIADSLYYPRGVSVDAAGNVYIADTVNNLIRKVSGTVVSIVAGNGSAGFSGDGGPPGDASVYYPQSAIADRAGNVYIADTVNNRIREVLAIATSYQASPATLVFSGTAGGNAPGPQGISLISGVPGLAFSVSTNADWLTLNPSIGTIPATLQVTADPSGLAAGTYQAIITITAPNASPRSTTVAVTFNVQSGTPASLAVDTPSISFTTPQGGGPLTQPVHVVNAGGGSLPFTVTIGAAAAPWLSVLPLTGTATATSPVTLTLTATPGTLGPGTYSGTITVSGAGATRRVSVTLSVSAPAATILLSQSALTFTAVAQGGVPLPQSFGILNTGSGSMKWTATASTLSGGNWLQISSSSGTVENPFADVSLVNVSVTPVTLAAGIYYGRIQVSAVAGNTPQLITVILNVLPAGFRLGPQLFPSGLIFTGTAGATPGSQDVEVANPGGQNVSFVSGLIGTGFSFLPAAANVAASQPTTVHVYPDYSKLAPGTVQRGTITLQFSDGSPAQTVTVLTVVGPSGATPQSLSPRPRASGCGVKGLIVVYRTPQSSQTTFNAMVGQATTIEVRVTDQCGNPIGTGGLVTALFSDSESTQLTHIGSGIWQGSWIPASVPSGPLLMHVLALAGQDSNTQGAFSPVLTALVTAPGGPGTPLATAQGVVHAASSLAGAPIAPGGLISIYGQNLSDGTQQSGGLPLPQQLNGTQVSLGTQPLPILYTSPGQLNVQVPYGVPINGQYQLNVQHGNTASVPQQLVVAAAQPGIFTLNQQGTGQAIILKSDQVTLAQSGAPASIGEIVVIYCTGLGAVTPAVLEGAPAPVPAALAVNSVTVTIGGQPAEVKFSGLTPGFAGLYQINAVVPAGIATGDSVPVVLTIAGQTSPPVTMAIR